MILIENVNILYLECLVSFNLYFMYSSIVKNWIDMIGKYGFC